MDQVVRMTARAGGGQGRGRGHEAVCVSHQLPIWIVRQSCVERRRLWHDPRKRQCTLASLTSFTVRGDRLVSVGYSEPGRGSGCRVRARGPEMGCPVAPLSWARWRSVAGCSSPTADTRTQSGLIAAAKRKTAPAVTGDLLEGGTFDLAAQKGHVVVVNFWASWCAPCRAEAADLESVLPGHKGVRCPCRRYQHLRREGQGDRVCQRRPRSTYPSLFDPAGKISLGLLRRTASRRPLHAGPSTCDGSYRLDHPPVHPGPRISNPSSSRWSRRNGWILLSPPPSTAGSPLSSALAIPAGRSPAWSSFLSPCVLPLVPGYLSYVTGLVGADLSARAGRIVKVHAAVGPGPGRNRDCSPPDSRPSSSTTTVLVRPASGYALLEHARVLEMVVGGLIIVLRRRHARLDPRPAARGTPAPPAIQVGPVGEHPSSVRSSPSAGFPAPDRPSAPSIGLATVSRSAGAGGAARPWRTASGIGAAVPRASDWVSRRLAGAGRW